MDRYLSVLVGAGLGGLLRFLVGTAISARWGGRFPIATFLINVSGAFLAGLTMTVLTARPGISDNWRLFLVVGVLGGYTTFSTFAYETLVAVHGGERWTAFGYVLSSVIFGYGGVWLGSWLGSRQ